MWLSLGFKNSPYDANALHVSKEDVELLVGREKEAVTFQTLLESAQHGVCTISGLPGVGKTSFFNIQQYLLENGEADFGPKLLAARELCKIQPDDNVRSIALRALGSLLYSIDKYCKLKHISVPNETHKVNKWINQRPQSNISLGLEILGCGGSFGRSIEVPSINDISFEGVQDVISCVVAECINVLGFEGVFIGLDNIENLDESFLQRLLISFRDTLFTIPFAWWVLIGQSGLSSLIKTLDPRVAERLTGSGLELPPIGIDALHEAIEKRVLRFFKSKKHDAIKAPLPTEIHNYLYKASHGEIRFVFKYSSDVCLRFINKMRENVLKDFKQVDDDRRSYLTRLVNEKITQIMVESQIPPKLAMQILREIVVLEITGLQLKNKEKNVLDKIGKNKSARAKDYKDYNTRTLQDFSSNYLLKFYKQHLLHREQKGRSLEYSLRGLAFLASEFDQLK